jgi:DNA-binding MarR family transcriptional regulator
MIQKFSSNYPEMDITSVKMFLTFIKLSRQIENKLDLYFAEEGISFSRFIVLMLIERENQTDMTASMIAKKINLSKKNLSRLLKGMENTSLIKSVQNVKDLRSNHLKVTKKGARLLDSLLPNYFSIINDFFQPFNESEKNLFTDLLYNLAVEL